MRSRFSCLTKMEKCLRKSTNVMKFLRELCLVLTEIWRFFIIIVTMRVYVCYPLSVTRN